MSVIFFFSIGNNPFLLICVCVGICVAIAQHRQALEQHLNGGLHQNERINKVITLRLTCIAL